MTQSKSHKDSKASQTETDSAYLPGPEIRAVWEKIYGRLRKEFGEAAYRSWLRPLTLQAFYQGTLEVSVPTRFMKDWILSHYASHLFDMVFEEGQGVGVRRLEIVVVPSRSSAQSGSEQDSVETSSGSHTAASLLPQSDISPKANQNRAGSLDESVRSAIADMTAPLDSRFTFQTFVTGKPNALAHAAARRVAESTGVPFNPFYIYGGVGLGKTHLMHAIAWAMRETAPERQVMYLSAEKFMFQFVRALRARDAMSFKEMFRSVDVLMIDDIQFIAGKESTQEEFFHTFNALVDQNKQIIISADRPPSDMVGIEERLRSRLSWGLVVDIQPTTYELRLGILKAKRDLLGAECPDSVLEFLALKITSNVRELEGALNRLVAHAQVARIPIDLESTQEVLQDLLRAHNRRLTIDEIQNRVADHYAIRLSDMHSARRARNVARPRQVAMYLSKHLTARSLPDIGRKFGGRDHTTVMHAVRKIEELMISDDSIAQDVEILRRALVG